MDRRKLVGSYTAKGGFKNETDIAAKFNNYRNDDEVKKWLFIMGYEYSKIQNLTAIKIPPSISKKTALDLGVTEENFEESQMLKKSDIQIRLTIIVENICYIENISLKKANKNAGYNQVDKRPVDKYRLIWNIPDSICKTLKLFTGELKPNCNKVLKDERRMYLNEIDAKSVDEMISFFKENKTLIVSDIIRGRGGLAADWLLVTKKSENNIDWVIKDINYACNFFAKGNVEITKRGNLKIGKVAMQRKGGTPDPESLQFKINPLHLFS